MLLIISQMIEIPMMISLEGMPFPPAYQNYQYFIDYYFWAVMALQFNIGIYEKGVLIKDRWVIAKVYLSTWFILDLLANFPFEAVILSMIDTQGENN